MAPKKVTRKQLLKEPDEFITLSGKLIQFAREHQNQLGFIAGAFFLCLIAVSGYSYYKSQTERKAFGKLNTVTKQYEEVRRDKGAEAAYTAVASELKNIVDEYNSTKAGRIARIAYANFCYLAKQYDQALAAYQVIRNDFAQNPIYQSLMDSSLGYTYWNKHEYASAVKHFNQIIDKPTAPLKDDALFSAAALYRTTERLPEHQSALKRIVSDHPDSFYTDLVTELTGTDTTPK